MKIVLCDTRINHAQKDFAGGFGVGMFPGRGGWRGRVVRYMYHRDRRPVALVFAYLSAIFKRLGHQVTYTVDRTEPGDIFVFNPALMTAEVERQWILRIRNEYPAAKVLVVGQVAFAMPEYFAGLGATIVRGEPEQLLHKLDDVLQNKQSIAEVGNVATLDELPIPDWSPFAYSKFKINYDFSRFPTAYLQQSRGCTFKCNYCPYILVESKTRFRDPDAVIDEMKIGIRRYGFESFKFRDPLFGLNRKNVLALSDKIRQLPKKIQFSIETRIDLMRDQTLMELKRAGLTSITVGIETPDEDTLRRYRRAPIDDDRQQAFIVRCRELGIRTVAGFMVGFPDDTRASILNVLDYARKLNPTFANFNIVTPYPGTEFFRDVRSQIADFDFGKYNVYQPVMKYKFLTSEQVADLHASCFDKFYFRSRYIAENARLLWPSLNRLAPRNSRAA
jgi:radical SAM superfamily enzyme YgiQ (UPF0313 family)